MKTFLFTIKDDYENLVSFSLDSELGLRELVKSKEFLVREFGLWIYHETKIRGSIISNFAFANLCMAG